MEEIAFEFQLVRCAFYLARCEVCGVGELICVKLFWILKRFLAVSRHTRVEAQADQDGTERECKRENSVSLSSMCKVLVTSLHGRWHKESYTVRGYCDGNLLPPRGGGQQRLAATRRRVPGEKSCACFVSSPSSVEPC